MSMRAQKIDILLRIFPTLNWLCMNITHNIFVRIVRATNGTSTKFRLANFESRECYIDLFA